MSEAKWIIGIVLLLTLAWVALGGPEQYENRERGPFFTVDIGKDRSRNDDPAVDDGDPVFRGTSRYSSMVTLDHGRAESDNYRREYLELRAHGDNTQPVPITGWRLKSPLTGVEVVIGPGTTLPRAGSVNHTSQIVLSAGETAILSTGQSHIGVNFRTNKCTGYFDQFRTFYPPLSRECPRLRDENLVRFGITVPLLGEDYDECIEAIEDVPECRLESPGGLRDVCRDFIHDYAQYNGCVALHKNDTDFFGDEWRIFFLKLEDIWRDESEVIMLFDQFGDVVDVVTY